MIDLKADFVDAMREYNAAAREAERANERLGLGDITRQVCEVSAAKLLAARTRLNNARLRLLGSETSRSGGRPSHP